MKKINTYWEERNLGVSSEELIIDDMDELSLIDKEISESKAIYAVAKVSGLRNEIVSLLQEKGFVYIEDQIELEHDLHEINRSSVMQRMYDSLICRRMDDNDLNELYEEIGRGMFYTDRISMDKHFSKEIAAKRYINWIKDLVSEGAIPVVEKYKGESAGFFIIKSVDDKLYNSILGGGYEKYNKTGLGTVLKEMEYVRGLGGKRIRTSVSSNNIRQFRNLIINGYLPVGVKHVFTRYIEK
ncbi:hypothetical protein SAMN02910369_01327 [Lachnospiraceae bacterium NE2001]|nr:hypothetical protein SAMN02910369_01327 [Lachnospiraceae bacterium NE2001]